MINNIKTELYHVGKVTKIIGIVIEVEALRQKNSKIINFNGEQLENIHVFGKVIVKNGYDYIVVDISGEYTKYENEEVKRFFNCSVSGSIVQGKYISGIEGIPQIGNDVYLLNDEIARIISPESEKSINIGNRVFNNKIKMDMDVNKLYASHIGIFGNTGSGKSYTLAKLMQEYFAYISEYEKDKNFIFDLTGEYSNCNFLKEKKVYDFKEKNLPDINISIDSLAILLNATEATQKPLLQKSYNTLKDDELELEKIIAQVILSGNDILNEELLCLMKNSDDKDYLLKYHTELYYGNNKVFFDGKEILNEKSIQLLQIKLSQRIKENILNEIVSFKIEDLEYLNQLYLCLLSETATYNNIEYIMPLIERFSAIRKEITKYITLNKSENIKELPTDRLTIYNLSEISSEYQTKIVTLLIEQWYSLKNKDYFVKFIIDEAHNIMSTEFENESNYTNYSIKILRKILKEGRKHNVFCYISSQRPAELDQTIISQLHNFFIHSLKNVHDIAIVEKTVPFITKEKIQVLPTLSTGNALFSGLASQDSEILSINKVEERNIPNSHNIDIALHKLQIK